MRALVLVLVIACEKPSPSPRPEPIPAPVPAPPLDASTLPVSACYTLVLRVDPGGTWIGAPSDVRCYAPFAKTEPDATWIGTELKRLRDRLRPLKCFPQVELGATTGVTYQQIASVMDAMWRNGFTRIEVIEPAALPMSFEASQRVPQCTVGALDVDPTMRTPKRKRPPPPPPPSIDPAQGGTLSLRRRIDISRDAIFVDGTKALALADIPAGTGVIAALATALGRATDDNISAAISADLTTDAAMFHRVVATARSLDYDYLSFQVEQR